MAHSLQILDMSYRILEQVVEHPWIARWKSHAHVDEKPQFGLNEREIEPALLKYISDRFGFRQDHVQESLRASAFNHATATYSLLEEMGFR